MLTNHDYQIIRHVENDDYLSFSHRKMLPDQYITFRIGPYQVKLYGACYQEPMKFEKTRVF